MRSRPRLLAATYAALPALAAAQADGAATGRSAWNWVLGIAALVVVIALAVEIFAPAGRARRAQRGR